MTTNTPSSATHRMMQKSSTLSRKYVKKPSTNSGNVAVKINTPKKQITIAKDDAPKKSIAVTDEKDELDAIKSAAKQEAEQIIAKQVEEKPAHQSVRKIAPVVKPLPAAEKAPISADLPNLTAAAATPKKSRLSSHLQRRAAKPQKAIAAQKAAAKARQAKDREIRKALRNAITSDEKPVFKPKHTGKKALLAITCSALVVAGLAVFVNLNMPDISVKVAALQSGVEASYPTYIPRGYSLGGISADRPGMVVIEFNSQEGHSFTLSEETSAWDSNALLSNFVRYEYSSSYATLREQGITIYVDGSKAAWVNGGILYKIECAGTNLTKEQIRNIAVSL